MRAFLSAYRQRSMRGGSPANKSNRKTVSITSRRTSALFDGSQKAPA